MTEDRPIDPNMPEMDQTPTGPSPLAILMRRWPLLAVGIAAGTVLGLLIHMSSTPAYMSTAKLLVIKRRDMTSNNTATAVVEDYVSAQISVIKSEMNRKAAAMVLKDKPLKRPLPDDTLMAANFLAGGFDVQKDRETAQSGSVIGNGVLDLKYRGADPSDTKVILEGIIDAYKNQLAMIFDDATAKRLSTLQLEIKTITDQKERDENARARKRDELLAVTNEEMNSIRARLTLTKSLESKAKEDLIRIEGDLKLIASASKNTTERNELLSRLTGRLELSSAASVDTSSPEFILRRLKAQKAQLASELGEDHTRMRALTKEIEFHQSLINKENPTSESRPDALYIHKLFLENSGYQTKNQLDRLRKSIESDEDLLKRGDKLNYEIDTLNTRIKNFENQIDSRNNDRIQLQATKTSDGSYEAKSLTPPGDGGKVAPVLFQSLLLGLALGLIMGGGAIAIAEFTDRGFRSPEEIRRRLGLNVIGHLPHLRIDLPPTEDSPELIERLDPSLVTALRPKSVESEGYRGVRTQVFFSTQGRGHQVIQVTSPSPGDGKSTLAANLAISMAQAGKRTVLLDCDFRKPRVHRLFKLSPEVGLAKVVSRELPLASALKPSGVTHLDILPCGPRPANPAELLTSPSFQQVLAELRAAYDFVVIDTPPLLAVSDPAAVAPRVDGVLLVFRLTNRARPSAERAREQLSAIGANILGVVVNGWTGGIGGGYHGYNYGYGYGYGYGYKYSEYEYAESYEDPSGEFPAVNASSKA